MKDVSLFQQVLKIAPHVSKDLNKFSSPSRRDFEDQHTLLFRAQLSCLEYASLMIENALLLRTRRSGRIYAGFERLSQMQPVVDRYLRIADVSDTVYVFGENDWRAPRHPNLRYIHLPSELTLAHESFLIADCPNHHAALVARPSEDCPGQHSDTGDFNVFKSSNPVIVSELAQSLEGVIDRSVAI